MRYSERERNIMLSTSLLPEYPQELTQTGR